MHTTKYDYVPNGTRVLNITDGEPGYIVNGFAFDPEIGWFEYEVETEYGIEVWKRDEFILFSEFENDHA
ncbi:MAG: hypothetical protein KatS3mg105_2220 [Gemmatales bacterium]|nr:MAG: hypothetical protein KatS3mg105_2220 [Gemmatales bacterium]